MFSGTVHLAADHAGFELKQVVLNKLKELGYTVSDLGAHAYDESDDYPALVRPAAEAVAQDTGARAIIFGKSGQGEAMVANRVKGVRAAVYAGGDPELVRLTREHNDANVLSIGAGFVSDTEACRAAELFLETAFSNEERHVRRIRAIDE